MGIVVAFACRKKLSDFGSICSYAFPTGKYGIEESFVGDKGEHRTYEVRDFEERTHFNKEISIIKLTAFIRKNPMIIIDIIEQILLYDDQPGDKIKALAKYCCYEKRKKRANYH